MDSKVSYQIIHPSFLWSNRTKVSTVANITMAWITLLCCSKDLISSISGRWLTPKPKRTDLIDPSTGSRRSQDKRTVPSKENCGQSLLGTSVTGETTVRKDSVFSSTRMATSTKECGPWTKNMVKALTGETKTLSSGENILEIGLKTKSTEEVPSFSRTLTDTTDTGWTACLKVKVEWSTPTATSTKANGMKARGMAMVCSQRETATISKATGWTTSEKDKDLISTLTRTSSSLASGLTTNQRLVCTLKSRMKMLRRAQRDHTSKTLTSSQLFQSWNWQTQQGYWKKLWREPRESDLTSEFNTYLSRKCSLLKS